MTEAPAVHGIHHVTAIAGSAQENLTFYAGVLGMRLVKRSVNQDDPGTYHLFYADAAGSPGQVSAKPSTKICAPTCSATTVPLRAIEPLSGGRMPDFIRRYAVCSVELPSPPHQSTDFSSTM